MELYDNDFCCMELYDKHFCCMEVNLGACKIIMETKRLLMEVGEGGNVTIKFCFEGAIRG